MANLSLYDLNNLVNSSLANLQNQINSKQATFVEDSTHRWFTDTERTKLSGIQIGAEANQNAFSNIKIDTAILSAENKTDTLEFVSGANIDIITDITNDKIIINNTYTHPNAHLASIITQDATHRFVSDSKITYWDAKASSDTATETTDGLLSAVDKAKLNTIQTGAQPNLSASEALVQLMTVDGNGSGLDADLLDGKHGSAYALTGHTHSKAEMEDFAHTHVGTDITSAVKNAETADGLNIVSGNTLNMAFGFNGGNLYINHSSANAPITEYKMCNGMSSDLADVRAKNVYADLKGTADYAKNADLLDGYQASDFVLNNGGIIYGPIKVGDANTQILKGDNNTVRFSTPFGHLEIGAQDASFAYLNTDRPSFYFNQPKIYADGHKVWHEGNMGIGSGLNADKLDGHDWGDVQEAIYNSFTHTLSLNGWTKMPNGVVIQWGNLTATSPSIIMFPLTFPNVCFGVAISSQDNTTVVSQDRSAYNIDRFSFERNICDGKSFWIAIGF